MRISDWSSDVFSSDLPVRFETDPECFQPFKRDPATLARAWAVPGTAGLEHRIGGIEKASDSGNISYDSANHQKMTELRLDKLLGVTRDVPPQGLEAGGAGDPLAVARRGPACGRNRLAVHTMQKTGQAVAHLHATANCPCP